MINSENIPPEKIAYDRPSEKLLKFLRKYYNLQDYIPQNNNYVVFNEYFLNKNSKSNNKYSNDDNYKNTKNNNEYWEENITPNYNKTKTLANTNSMVNLNAKSIIS